MTTSIPNSDPHAGRDPARAPAITIIVPTLNEGENIDPVIERILAATKDQFALEVLIADGGSTDQTVERVNAWSARAPVRLVQGATGRGLAGDVLHAAGVAANDIVVVMDADLSHPPEKIPALVAPIIAGQRDMVVGSRYVPGGAVPDWPLKRRLLSRLGGLLAWPLTEVRDPMSGFFAIRRPALLAVDPMAAGFKICLEALVRGGGDLRVAEEPIVFHDRLYGSSKIGLSQMLTYVRRLMLLAGGAVSAGNATRFLISGLIGLGVDLLSFQIMLMLGVGPVTAQIISFGLATLSNYTMNARWSFAATAARVPGAEWRRYLRFLAVCLLALFLRGAVFGIAHYEWGLPPQAAVVFGIVAVVIVNYFGNAFYVFPPTEARTVGQRWRIAALGVLAYVTALRVLFLGLPDLLPEEAYYWTYAQHLDIGYLDHPPMVAWLIALGTTIFGQSEFAVRVCALLIGLVTIYFSYRLASELFDKTTGLVAACFAGVLPFFFSSGFLMTPDSPLTACWAAALFYLQRALLREQRAAWWAVGIALGLGLLSKYTIALLVPATFLLMLIEPRMRRWFARPEPYGALGVGLLIFAPVIYWNATHGWASFSFQGPERLQASVKFSSHILLASALGFLTPIGLASAFLILVRPWGKEPGRNAESGAGRARARFAGTLLLLPLAVFVAFSVAHQVKLDWSGPLWLAILPAIAHLAVTQTLPRNKMARFIRRAWAPTVLVLLLLYGGGLHYLTLGLPGLPNPSALRTLPIAWREFGAEAKAIEELTEGTSGAEPLLIGMDKYFIASELGFYARDVDDRSDEDEDDRSGENADRIAGRNLFGEDSLMFARWSTSLQAKDRVAILFGFTANDIDGPEIQSRFRDLGPIHVQKLFKKLQASGEFYYRVGVGYLPPP